MSEDSPTRRLTTDALRRLNELVAQGVPFGDAMKQVADYEVVPEPEPPGDPEPPARPTAPWPEVRAALDAIFEELTNVGVLEAGAQTGCTPDEIDDLARDTDRRLPLAYRHVLARVGKVRTRFISHNHIAAELHELRRLQVAGDVYLRRKGITPDPDAFYMLACLGDAYHYVVCDVPDAVDAVVWVAHDGLDEPIAAYGSIVGMVRDLADDALRAWNSGYFAERPNGTTA